MKNFKEFWPFYMAQHRNPVTWRIHAWGTICGLTMLFVGASYKPIYFLAAPLVSYGPLFLSHFLIEKNKPATFKYPFWSVAGDFKLLQLYFSRKLEGEIKILEMTKQIPSLPATLNDRDGRAGRERDHAPTQPA